MAAFLQWLRGLPCTVDVVCVQEAHCVSSVECEFWFPSSVFFFFGCVSWL